MKKFYISIFTVVFLLSSFLSKAQVYNSILTNPLNYTLDDYHFWLPGTPGSAPPNPCTGCTINVYSSVTVAHNGGSSLPIDNGPWLNHITLSGSTLKLQGAGTVLSIDTYLSLTNSTQVIIASDPSYNVTILLNDQVDMDATSGVQIGNINSYIDANNIVGNTIQGPYDDFANSGVPDAGIYSILTTPIGGQNYSLTLNTNGIGTALNDFAFYSINCSGGPGFCTFGNINGPAITAPNATYGVIFQSSTTLPVILVFFVANKQDDGSNLLSWATSQEQNSAYYDVERSSDQSSWITLGTVNAKGFSSTTTNYSYSDKLPLDGVNYYRLKMVDLDGKFTYSKTVTVTSASNSQALVIYSNPFTDQIRLKVNVSMAQNLTMTVTDMLGRTYINQSYQAQSGDNYVNLIPNAGGNGMYILRIHGDTYDQTVKLEKQ